MLAVIFYIEKINYNKNDYMIFFVYLHLYIMLYKTIIENIKIVNTIEYIFYVIFFRLYILYLYDIIIKEIYI